MNKTDDRIKAFTTWIGPPVPPHSEKIAFIPSELNGKDDKALYIIDDGLQCIVNAIERVVPEYGPTIDFDILPEQWKEIIEIWKSQLEKLEDEMQSFNIYDYPPYSSARRIVIQLENANIELADGIKQFCVFVSEVIEYLENHLKNSSHITLTGL